MLKFIIMVLIIGAGLLIYYTLITYGSTLTWYDQDSEQIHETFTFEDDAIEPNAQHTNYNAIH